MKRDGYRWRWWRTTSIWGANARACRSYRCGRETVGYSVWCRGHTDAIFFAPKSEQPTAEHWTPLYFPTDEERIAKFGSGAVAVTQKGKTQ